MARKKMLLLLVLPVIWAGCKSQSIYYWGHYQQVVYAQYDKPGKSSPEELSAVLEEDLHKAASLNQPVPPGFHAQLGYLYALSGKTDQARQQYELEKQQFPESAVFMNRLLGNKEKK